MTREKGADSKHPGAQTSMTDNGVQGSRDWLASAGSYVLAWGLPHFAIIAGLAAPVPARTAVWTVALLWMGAACLINARRCGRTHCRFTGPYYLAMIAPVLVFGSGLVALGFSGWLVLAALILLGSKIIWWVTERTFGKFS
jgi:hypothetical protein